MFNSKVFTAIVALTLAILAGAVTMQLLEMKEYNLFEAIKKSFMGEEPTQSTAPAAPEQAKDGNATGEPKAAE
jgi:hypothetical protein